MEALPGPGFYVFTDVMLGGRGEPELLVPISPDRWPAVVGSEQDVVSVFLTVQGSKT